MSDRSLSDLRASLDDMAALKPWANAANPEDQPFVAAFSAARASALAAAPAYVEAAGRSQDLDLKTWLKDMAALLPWTDVDNPEHRPFVAAFSAARANALAAASPGANGAA